MCTIFLANLPPSPHIYSAVLRHRDEGSIVRLPCPIGRCCVKVLMKAQLRRFYTARLVVGTFPLLD
jgi:hypothetical protein